MSANLKVGFVIDVEATAWETPEEQGNQPNEVIEIGVAVLDYRSGKVVDSGSIAVRPRFTRVSPFCTQLTGWTQEAVEQGLDIAVALREFQNRFKPTKAHLWWSYGEYDRVKLSSLSGPGGLGVLYGINAHTNPFDAARHLNIKTLFALKHKLKREIGMARALALVNEELEGRHHSGVDDAKNIAKLVWNVMQ